MAQQKIRLPTITAELKQWRLDKNSKTVIGLVVNDTRKDGCKDLEPIIIRNFRYALYYPLQDSKPLPYFLVRTNVNEYFKLDFRDEKK